MLPDARHFHGQTVCLALVASLLACTAASAQPHTEPPSWSWQRGTSSEDQVAALASSRGALFAAGHTFGQLGTSPASGLADFFLARLGEDGSQQWLLQNGSSSSDYATGLALDDRAATVLLYVSGYTGGSLDGVSSAGGQDAFLTSYDAQGNRRWTRLLGTSAADFAQAVATGPDGSVFIAGYTSGALSGASAGGQDAFIARYDAQGTLQWVRQFGTSKNDQARGVAVDAEGSIYVTGQTFGSLTTPPNPSTTTSDLFLAKFSAQGTEQWRRQRGTAGTETAQAVATSRRGSGEVEVYVAGRTSSSLDGNPSLGNYDVVLLKYDTQGNAVWTRQSGSAGDDSAQAVTADGGGNAYLVGYVPNDVVTGASLGSNDVLLLKYDASGALVSRRQLGASGSASSDWGLAVAADRGMGLYVGGFVSGALGTGTASGGRDAAVVKYQDGCEANTSGQCALGYGWGRPGWQAVAAGIYYSLGVRADGTVRTWGANYSGQLGDGTTSDRSVPVEVAGLSGMMHLAAGESHALAVASNGTVQAWGDNLYGQLGDGSGVDRIVPGVVPGLAGITSVAAGYWHSLALASDGSVKAWGNNTYGQTGDGTTNHRMAPVSVVGLSSVAAIASGRFHSLALRSDGTVYAWGRNTNGQLGDGTISTRLSPVQVPGLSGIVAITAGENHSLALRSDGTVYAWGSNSNGQLGDGTTTQRLSPVPVPSLSGVKALGAGYQHSLAVLNDGTARAWGNNTSGQLGNGSLTSSNVPVVVAGLSEVTAVAGGFSHSLAVLADGALRAWGYNYYGQLGNGAMGLRPSAVAVSPLPTRATAVAAGASHSVVLLQNGTAQAWGANTYGQLGDGTTLDRSLPTTVPGLPPLQAVACGSEHTLTVAQDGTVYTWGRNTNGQLGDGTTNHRSTPQQVPGLAGVVSVSAGYGHSLALMSDGTVATWGDNAFGQLGDGTTTRRTSPVPVPGLAGVVAVSANGYHSLALLADGSVRAWGRNTNGQLGDGTTTQRTSPVSIPGLTASVVSAGGTHTLALAQSTQAWGSNTFGQLGDGTTTQRTAPTSVMLPAAVYAAASGDWHSLVLLTDGTLRAWGRNNNGQLGDGSTTQSLTFVTVTGVFNATAAASGSQHSLALLADGSLRAWGYNYQGQLGNGERGYEMIPVAIP
jgi:alpha-tubulin suppressor-like RCC1 family protein